MPRRWVTLDTEAWRTTTAKGELQTFRLAVATFDHQKRKGDPWQPSDTGKFRAPEDLWRWVDDRCVDGKRTVLLAHNLAYDLRVGQAFDWLPKLGWTLEIIRLDSGSTWASWRCGARSLTMVDTVSWFGASVERLGELLGVAKLPLPTDADDDATWFDRCGVDVAILRCAWLRTLDWLEAGDFGTWKPTGAGQGWAAFRHRWMDTRILHHGVLGVAAAEREAAWTGRCEAWRWGPLPRGVWSEWDFTSAYAQVAADVDLPVRLTGHMGPVTARRALDGAPGRCSLIRCTITQATPVAPSRGPYGILWPVGTFSGWYWDVECAEVLRSGGQVECHEGWSYEAAPALRTWANWVLDVLEGPVDAVDPMARLVVKGWSRSLIGRFGSRWSEWAEYGEAHEPGVHLSTVRSEPEGRTFRMLTLGDRCIAEGATADADDGAVAVMSYVMTVSRLRVLAAMAVAGVDHLAYVDTDGVLVDEAGADRLRDAALPGLREKSRWRRVEVLGPRQLVLDGRLRAAGVSSRAVRVGPQSWAGEVWQGLGAALATNQTGAVAVTSRTWRLRGTDHRRAHCAGGLTEALPA
jgi:hypothetical protein